MASATAGCGLSVCQGSTVYSSSRNPECPRQLHLHDHHGKCLEATIRTASLIIEKDGHFFYCTAAFEQFQSYQSQYSEKVNEKPKCTEVGVVSTSSPDTTRYNSSLELVHIHITGEPKDAIKENMRKRALSMDELKKRVPWKSWEIYKIMNPEYEAPHLIPPFRFILRDRDQSLGCRFYNVEGASVNVHQGDDYGPGWERYKFQIELDRYNDSEQRALVNSNMGAIVVLERKYKERTMNEQAVLDSGHKGKRTEELLKDFGIVGFYDRLFQEGEGRPIMANIRTANDALRVIDIRLDYLIEGPIENREERRKAQKEPSAKKRPLGRSDSWYED
ncbi:hypothetical protein F5Y15DRAFT_373645 [Xylariaceae sp. FL0016]|nr:hypothetical protein F5Y15DRAFT_373645 [Xylariaceae sp. FL0016]